MKRALGAAKRPDTAADRGASPNAGGGGGGATAGGFGMHANGGGGGGGGGGGAQREAKRPRPEEEKKVDDMWSKSLRGVRSSLHKLSLSPECLSI